MRAAAAKMVLQCLLDLGVIGAGIAIQKRLRGHDHAVQTVSALRRLSRDECLLNRMRTLRVAEPFQGDDLPPHDITDRHHARTDAVTVDQNGAGAAFAQPASKLGAVQRQIVAQRVQQHGACRNVEQVPTPVDVETKGA